MTYPMPGYPPQYPHGSPVSPGPQQPAAAGFPPPVPRIPAVAASGLVILSEQPLRRFGSDTGRAPLRAAVTAVYARSDGSVCPLGRPLRPFEALFSGYRTRYEVGVADHEGEFDIGDELPSREDVFRFYARLQIGFRVHDPAEVVRRRIRDGFQLARWRLLEEMRPISRKYPTEECARANEEINSRLGANPLVLPEGITVYRFAAFLSLDAQTQEALRERVKVRHEQDLEQNRLAAVRQAIQGDHGLLVLHMARHPEDTERVLNMMTESYDKSQQTHSELFKIMAEKDLIQHIDLQQIRDENLRQILTAARAHALEPMRLVDGGRPAGQLGSGQPALGGEASDIPPPH